MLVGLYSRGRRAGKDTAANYISEWCRQQQPYKTYQRLAFANKPKLLVAEILGVKSKSGLEADTINIIDAFKLYGRIDIYLDASEPGPGLYDRITGRDFIINLCGEIGGDEPTGARKLFGESFWTDIVLPIDWEPTADITVITDVRADEEANRILWHGGEIWEIKNPRAEAAGGRSEVGLSVAPTREIWNAGTLPEFKVAVQSMVDILWHQWHTLH